MPCSDVQVPSSVLSVSRCDSHISHMLCVRVRGSVSFFTFRNNQIYHQTGKLPAGQRIRRSTHGARRYAGGARESRLSRPPPHSGPDAHAQAQMPHPPNPPTPHHPICPAALAAYRAQSKRADMSRLLRARPPAESTAAGGRRYCGLPRLQSDCPHSPQQLSRRDALRSRDEGVRLSEKAGRGRSQGV